MENNVCAAAVIYVPYLHKIYFADRGFGSYVRDRSNQRRRRTHD